jgi:histidyl-tRNA synthetase
MQKLYYLGPMFRRERPQKGRYRQFYQIGAEVLGSESPAVDVEVLEMLFAYLGRLGIQDFHLLLNSVGCGKCRPEYVKVLRRALEDVKAQMCADCQRRADTNPLRVFDCKVEADQPIIAKLPAILDHLCVECRQHFSSVTQGLEQRELPYEVTPRLVRGLDYYTRTTFEITSGALGAQNSVLGGGRYDGLSELLGGPPTPGIGFAIGEDRLVLTVEKVMGANSQAGHQTVSGQVVEAYIIWMEHDALRPAAELARSLRREGWRVELPYDLTRLKKAMGIANKLNARFAVIIGEQELGSARYQVKDMSTGQQEEVESDRIAGYLRDRLAAGEG